MSGKFFVIEGIDGSGKTTQLEMLQDYFIKNNYEVKTIHFPRHDTPFFGKMVDRYLDGDFGDPTKLDSYLATLLYVCDQWEGGKDIKKWIDGGFVVILDRYTTSNFGHQAGKIHDTDKRVQYQEWLFELAFNVFALPYPDKIFLLDIPVEQAIELIKKRQGETGGGHERSIEHLTDAKNAYQNAAQSFSNWQIIDVFDEKTGSLKTIDQINTDIITHIEQ